MLLLAGLLVLLALHGVNSQSARSICLNAHLNDVSRRDPACANQFVTLLNSQSLDTIPQSAVDEVCSTSCWNQVSPVIQSCYGEDVSVHQCCTVIDVKECFIPGLTLYAFN